MIRTDRFDRALLDPKVPPLPVPGEPLAVEVVSLRSAILRSADGERGLVLLARSAGLVPGGIEVPLELCPLVWGLSAVLCGTRLAFGPRTFAIELVPPGASLELPADLVPPFRALVQDAHLDLPVRTRMLLAPTSGSETDAQLRREQSTEEQLVASAARELADLVARLFGGLDPAGPIARLTGLGPGSTPTGDDLLIGLAASARRFRGLVDTARLEAALRATPAGSTTLAGRALLRHAGRGAFPERLLALEKALGTDEAARAARDLAAYGAHSGTEMLAGALALFGPCRAQRAPVHRPWGALLEAR